MEFVRAWEEEAEEVYELVQDTIRTIYPRYYPEEVVRFFSQLHNMENIKKDIEDGHVMILLVDEQLIGTGSYKGNYITRAYVSPAHQGQGYGSYIMKCLEEKIAREYSTVRLEASLPAARMYEQRGYRTLSHEKWPVKNGAVLTYEIMEKVLSV